MKTHTRKKRQSQTHTTQVSKSDREATILHNKPPIIPIQHTISPSSSSNEHHQKLFYIFYHHKKILYKTSYTQQGLCGLLFMCRIQNTEKLKETKAEERANALLSFKSHLFNEGYHHKNVMMVYKQENQIFACLLAQIKCTKMQLARDFSVHRKVHTTSS